MRIALIAVVCLLASGFVCLSGQTLTGEAVEILILDRDSRPVPGAKVTIRSEAGVAVEGTTDTAGRVAIRIAPGQYSLQAEKEGFEPLRKDGLDLLRGGASAIELTLLPALVQREQVEVKGKIEPLEQGASSNDLSAKTAKELPGRPATLADALPLIPGVVRSPSGDLQISGVGEHRSSLIVNSADVTDPATGQFGLTVPIDSVETVAVFQTPFQAEYGRFSAGLVSVATRRGGDTWKWELNDPLPDFRIRSYHLRGVRDASPRVNVEGPLVPHKLYFSEGLEYEVRNTEVHTLPFPINQTKKQGINSFAQFDWIASSRNLVTATIHAAPQRLGYVNLDYFNPQPTVPDASTHNYTGTIAHHLTLLGGMLENTFSVTQFDAGVWARGTRELNIAPWGNSGNYFAQQSRESWRMGGTPSYTLAPANLLGTHSFKIGAYFARSADQGQLMERPLNILDAEQRRLRRIAFFGGRPFDMSDTEYAAFAQDHWNLSTRFAADLGVRTESQTVSHSVRVAPRAGLAWVPFANTGTVVRAGFGLFFDRVPLNVYAFNHYPKQIVTLFDTNGDVAGGPFFYVNALGQVNTQAPFIFHRVTEGNFSPRAATGSIEVEQSFTRVLKLRVGYLRSISDGLITMLPRTPDPETMVGAYELSGMGSARYRQLEVTARVQLNKERQLFFSYVRNRAHGELNDFSNFIGSFPTAIIRPNRYGRLPGDLPHRFLAWGTVPLPKGFQIAPILEYRNGFSYSVTDAAQNYVGIPNHQRYPHFLSLDSRFSKDFKVNAKYTVRLSLVTYNLTNHFNPNTYHNNIADPAYGIFLGSRGRRHTADFDVLF